MLLPPTKSSGFTNRPAGNIAVRVTEYCPNEELPLSPSYAMKFSPGRPTREMQALTADLVTTLGSIETKHEIARASRYNGELRAGEKDQLKSRAWEHHLKKNTDRGRAWAEIMIYRATGENSAYFIPEQEDGTFLETGSVDELDVCAILFLRLVAEGRLDELEEFEKVKIEFPRDASLAEKFKAYMDVFRGKSGFRYRTYKEIIDLRFNLFQVLHNWGTEGKPTTEKRGGTSFESYSHKKAEKRKRADESDDDNKTDYSLPGDDSPIFSRKRARLAKDTTNRYSNYPAILAQISAPRRSEAEDALKGVIFDLTTDIPALYPVETHDPKSSKEKANDPQAPGSSDPVITRKSPEPEVKSTFMRTLLQLRGELKASRRIIAQQEASYKEAQQILARHPRYMPSFFAEEIRMKASTILTKAVTDNEPCMTINAKLCTVASEGRSTWMANMVMGFLTPILGAIKAKQDLEAAVTAHDNFVDSLQ